MTSAAVDSMGLGSLAKKPSLGFGIRWRLSVMMFLEFAVWGSWFTVFGIYCGASTASGGLGFDLQQIGSLYGTMALGAIGSMFFAGQLADRVLSSEFLMTIFHLVGAVLMYAMARTHDYNTLWYLALAYALVYNPTIAISNSISFANVPDATRDFPTLRVLGTLGWIAAGLVIDFAPAAAKWCYQQRWTSAGFVIDYLLPKGSDATNRPLLFCAALSAFLGIFSLILPHTPPSGKKGDAVPFISALRLLRERDFGIFFAVSFCITIALAFYYNFAGVYLKATGIGHPAATQTIGQGSEILFMLLLPLVLRRLGIKWVLGVGMGAWALRYGIFSLSHSMWLILVGVGLHGLCFDFFFAAGFIYTDTKAPPDIRGSAQALFIFLTYGVGMWLGNVLGGKIAKELTANNVTQWPKFWAIPAIESAICLLFFLLLWRGKNAKQ
jgi:nucleoside transporter